MEAQAINFRGVRLRKWGKWVSEIRLPNSRQRIWLGSYDSPEKAARAFDAALFCLRGHNANFNFPNQPPNIPGGTDLLEPSQIQAAAAEYANSSSSPSPSPPDDHVINNNDVVPPEPEPEPAAAASMELLLDTNNNSCIISDYEMIFPGFDDDSYLMPQPPAPLINNYEQDQQVIDYDHHLINVVPEPPPATANSTSVGMELLYTNSSSWMIFPDSYFMLPPSPLFNNYQLQEQMNIDYYDHDPCSLWTF